MLGALYFDGIIAIVIDLYYSNPLTGLYLTSDCKNTD